jgi:hypothetical protein
MPDPDYQSYNGLPIAPAPPNLPVSAPDNYTPQFLNQTLNVLRLYFNQLNNYTQATATPDFSTTQNRPTTGLQTGQIYFDTTLNTPIWWNGSKWVNSSGTDV